MNARIPGDVFRFGPYRLDLERGLTRAGEMIPLGQRARALLAVLLTNPGRLVTKGELMIAAWAELSVEDSNLTTQIWALRQALGDTERPYRWIVTIPGRGYRFIGAVDIETAGAVETDEIRPQRPDKLPYPMTKLFGRDFDLAAVQQHLARHRLVTIQGPAGIGKTKLAVEAGRRFGQGCAVFIDLAVLESDGLESGGLVASAAARALGVSLDGATPPLHSVIRAIADRPLLLLLDNCEHVAAAAAGFAEAVLTACPSVQILATSRERLACIGEQVLPLGSLAVPPAAIADAAAALDAASVALLVDRVQAIDPNFTLTDAQAAAASIICRKLDGLPLAIEMVGAWIPVFDLPGVAARLEDSLPSGGLRTAPARHRSLDAALDWSHALLRDDERIGLRRLAVFAGAFTLAAAEAVIGDAALPVPQIAEILLGLQRKSLLTMTAGDSAPGFRLLETTRAYARSKLRAAGELRVIQHAHARFVAARMRQALIDRDVTSDDIWDNRYGPDLDDLRNALDWAFGPDGDRILALAILGRSWPLWSMLSHSSEGVRRLKAALLLLGPDTPMEIEAQLQLSYGKLTSDCSLEISSAAFSRAAELFRASGNVLGTGDALARLGLNLAVCRQRERALALLTEARSILAGSGCRISLAFCAIGLSRLSAERGCWAEAREELETAAALTSAVGAQRLLTVTLVALAYLPWMQGDLDNAVGAARRALAQARRCTHPKWLGASLVCLAGLLIERGELAAVLPIAREALAQFRDDDTGGGYVDGLLDLLAALAGKSGRLDEAARLSGYIEAARQRGGMLRQPNEQRLFDDLAGRLAHSLRPAELVRLKALGALMTEEQALTMALTEQGEMRDVIAAVA